MRWPIWHITGMLVPQRRRKTGEIGIPPEAQQGDYDLVVFGSPTWWLTTCMPVRSYLESPAAKAVLDGKPFAGVSVSRRYYKGNLGDIKKLGEKAGGTWVGETHFVSEGDQVQSMASWLVFMRENEPRERYLGIRMPRPNLQADFVDQAGSFADEWRSGRRRSPLQRRRRAARVTYRLRRAHLAGDRPVLDAVRGTRASTIASSAPLPAW